MPRKKTGPKIVAGYLLLADALALRVDSPAWQDWLASHDSFLYESSEGMLTARREKRKGSSYWYAYRRRLGKLVKTYLGRDSEVTLLRLAHVSATVAGLPARPPENSARQTDAPEVFSRLDSATNIIPPPGSRASLAVTARADALARAAYEVALRAGSPEAVVETGKAWMELFIRQDLYRRAEIVGSRVLQDVGTLEARPPALAGAIITSLARISYERDQFEEAEHMLERAAALEHFLPDAARAFDRAVLHAKVKAARGDYPAALEALHRIAGRCSETDRRAVLALLAVQHGDILTAQAALQEIRGAPEHGTALLAQAWLFLEMGQPASAEAILSRLDERFPEVRRHDSAVLVSILSAAVLFRHCRFHRACRALTDALFAAGPEGLVRPFRTVGPRIAPLLALVLHKEKLSVAAHSLAHTLLQGFEHAGMLPPMPTPEGLRALVQAASISDREQEVLRRMEAGETNKDIARSLCITENTVKKHIRHIFEKLGMTNRMQAVARAKALNLV